jgi:hypothetical protein
MKTTLYCLLIAVALRLAFAQTVETHASFIDNADRVLIIKGVVAGDMKNWLIIESHNGKEWKQNGFDPTYTRVLCDYKPLFRKLPGGQWEIMFTSEIAENLP